MAMIINHLGYTYSKGTAFEKTALSDINIQIADGEFIGLIGHTGSGKSTLIQHLNGILKATEGGIYYNGQDIYDEDFSMKELRSKVGLVFQYPEYQLFETTVLEDVMFGPKNLGLDNLHVELRAFEALKQVGISEELFDVSPFDLSGGQKRRMAIAGVLAMEPEVLVLDEPTAGLDPKGRDEIYDLIKRLHRERKITVIIVSHSMEDMAKYVKRLIVMNNGRIMYDDTPANIFSHADELEKMGLSAPQITYVMKGLKRRGIDADTNVFTVEAAKQEIMRLWKKTKK